MERKRNFDIHFLGLKNAVHHFEYEIGASFFKLYEKSPLSDAKLSVKLDLDKKDSFFILNFQVDGTVNLACDRCNEPFDYELITDFEIIVKFEDMENGIVDEADVVYISRNDSSFNISDLIYDYILINIPMQVFHPNDSSGTSTCNPEILEKLKVVPKKEEEEIDPRWASLNILKSKEKTKN